MPTLTLAHGDVFYVSTVVPSVQPAERPVVLCLHGAGGSFRNFYHLFKDMGKTWPVVVPDLPGHGKSAPLPGTLTIPAYADFVESFLLALAGLWGRRPPVILLGHSMGGAIALEYAITRQGAPTAPAGLVLIGASARMRVRPEFLESLARGRFHPDLLRSLAEGDDAGGQRDADAGLSNTGAARQRARKEAAEREAEAARRREAGEQVPLPPPPKPRILGVGEPPEVVYRDLLACDAFDRRAELRSLGVPTLVIHGELDAMQPLRYAEATAAAIPGARLVVIPGAGHLVHHTKPDAVRRNVKVFAREIESRVREARRAWA